MKQRRADYSLVGMRPCFNVSRSGYYAWLRRKPSQRLQRRQALDEQVKFLFHQHQRRYGNQKDCSEKCLKKMVSRTI